LSLPTLTWAIAKTLSTPGNTQGSRELGGETLELGGETLELGGETPPLRLIGLKNEVIRVSGDLMTGPKLLAPRPSNRNG